MVNFMKNIKHKYFRYNRITTKDPNKREIIEFFFEAYGENQSRTSEL